VTHDPEIEIGAETRAEKRTGSSFLAPVSRSSFIRRRKLVPEKQAFVRQQICMPGVLEVQKTACRRFLHSV